MPAKEREKKWINAWESCKEWERGGTIRYNKAKTKALFVELRGRNSIFSGENGRGKDPVRGVAGFIGAEVG